MKTLHIIRNCKTNVLPDGSLSPVPRKTSATGNVYIPVDSIKIPEAISNWLIENTPTSKLWNFREFPVKTIKKLRDILFELFDKLDGETVRVPKNLLGDFKKWNNNNKKNRCPERIKMETFTGICENDLEILKKLKSRFCSFHFLSKKQQVIVAQYLAGNDWPDGDFIVQLFNAAISMNKLLKQDKKFPWEISHTYQFDIADK